MLLCAPPLLQTAVAHLPCEISALVPPSFEILPNLFPTSECHASPPMLSLSLAVQVVLALDPFLTVQGLLPASAADLAPARANCLVQVPVSETLYPVRMPHPIRSSPRAVTGPSRILLPCPVEQLRVLDRIPAPAPNREWHRRIGPTQVLNYEMT
jgi:hypothetical protein